MLFCGFGVNASADVIRVHSIAMLATFMAALALLGIGWNFMLVGGTTLLATADDPHERVRVQATNDFIVFGTVACTAFASGALEATAPPDGAVGVEPRALSRPILPNNCRNDASVPGNGVERATMDTGTESSWSSRRVEVRGTSSLSWLASTRLPRSCRFAGRIPTPRRQITYADGALDLGEAAAEQLALALDPYPRAADAVLPDLPDDPEAQPFPALKALQRRH